ncbi:hypothetical protein NE237_005648 [Protea cynaroides]|uniref:Late embryogenesis abundant protein LEA-2 subgroup domain-containing protein n=1 Tax=Protea cynaroides TaxID=273540 RepID=A0A9Q0KLK7_9MAGN|nr:hypothetical protein NE237_005648 [Protea cynaroides]
MAEVHKKIYPVDPEAPPTVRLVPQGSARSEKGDPGKHYPPVNWTYPVVHSTPPKKRSCCCRCLCWTISILIILVIIIAALVGLFFLIFRPKIPSYSVDGLRITELNFNSSTSFSAKFIVRLTIKNPNKKIGIYYENGSNLSAWYSSSKLCEGSLPVFYQGHHNTTVLNIELTGHIDDGNTLRQALSQQQQTGTIPLTLNAKVPVKVKLGKLKLPKVTPHANCSMVVDSLSMNNYIRIRTSNCKLKVKILFINI